MPADPRRAREVFLEVVDRAPEQRAAFLDEHCSDPEVRAEVEDLLRHHDGAGEWFSGTTRAASEPQPTVPLLDLIGRQIDDFAIVRQVGHGGMGIVYLARDVRLDRAVALKVLPPFASEHGIARFRNEAKAIARLEHPGIVPVYRVGEFESVHYIAMQFVEGPTLAAHIADERARRHEGAGDRRSTQRWHRDMAKILAKVADALEHAHQRSIIHRDVKPSNILLDHQGDPHLTDFGLAKNLSEDSLTRPGGIAGTARYMSPEQARAASSEIDHRTDIFSLGVVLYEAIALEPPFDGESVEQILNAVLSKQPKRLRQIDPGVTRDLETICHKAIEKERWHRYQTAGHLAADLRCFTGGIPILARPPSVARRTRHWIREHRVPAVAALVLVLLLLIAGLLWHDVRRRRAELCAVTLLSEDRGARVFVQRFDEESLEPGERRLVETIPMEDELFERGLYRFTVARDDGRFAEVTLCLMEAGGRSQIDVVTPARDDSFFSSMVRFERGLYDFGRPDGAAFERSRRVLLEAFWLDRLEVSNEQYRAFVDATGHAAPPHWKRYGSDPALARHPIVGVSWDDAQAYCRCQGKRLPTIFEWEGAARAPDGRLLPWGDVQPANRPEITASMIGRARSGDWNLAYEEYASRTRPVDDDLHPSQRGLYHTFGNVAEITENIDFRTLAMIVKGGDWIDSPDLWNLTRTKSLPYSSRSMVTGFRCAASDGVVAGGQGDGVGRGAE